MGNPIKTFSLNYLQPLGAPIQASKNTYVPGANLTVAEGTAMGQATATTQSEIQVVTAPVSGTFMVSFLGQTTAALNYSTTTAAQLQTALQALSTIGSGNATVTGSTGGPWTVTFAGTLAGLAQPLLLDPTVAATFSRTQGGWTKGSVLPYSSSLIASPTTAPTVTATGTDGSLAAGAYIIEITGVTAGGGESAPSDPATVAVASTNHIALATYTPGAGYASVNVYANGVFAKNVALTNGATGAVTITALASSPGNHVPNVSTAYAQLPGNWQFTGLAEFNFSTNQFGQIIQGSGNTGDEQLSPAAIASIPLWVQGRFNAADLTGLDAFALTGRGTIEQGTITAGVVRLF